MARIAYINRNFRPESEALIQHARAICAEYAANGYDLTLRQLYYQFVARGYLANTQKNYKRLGDVVNDARLAGRLDWDYIQDRTRNIEKRAQWKHPRDIIAAVAKQFHTDWWKDQDVHVEVWIEKEALAGVVEAATRPLDVTSLACRGYMSQSEQWAAAQRFKNFIEEGKRVVVIHLGDHDPSGIDMSRDNEERLAGFIAKDLMRAHGDDSVRVDTDLWDIVNEEVLAGLWDEDRMPERPRDIFELKRIALTMDQINFYNPPPNPAKVTDARFENYEAIHGDQSWELDALPPDVLNTLITDAIMAEADADVMRAAGEQEERYRARIGVLLERHGDVLDDLEEAG